MVMLHYSFFGFMIASGICMIGCVIAYRVLLENKVRPSINRLILLSIFIVAFLLPIFVATIPDFKNEPRIDLEKLEFGIFVNTVYEYVSSLSFQLSMIFKWLYNIYLLGIFIILLFTLGTIGHLVCLSRNSKKWKISDMEVNVHDNKKLSSFSWCNKIFLYKGALNLEFRELQMLVFHEKAHLSKGHWIDLAIAQIVLIFQWFNPAAWFIRMELQRIHEYEADEAVLKSGIDEKDYQMLLIQNISRSRYSFLTDGLNSCSLKKRIIMMKKTQFKKDWLTRGITVFGFAILAGLIIHVPAVASLLQVPKSAAVYYEENNQSKQNILNPDLTPKLKVNLNGEESSIETIKSLKSENIESMKIVKSDEECKIEVKTKNI